MTDRMIRLRRWWVDIEPSWARYVVVWCAVWMPVAVVIGIADIVRSGC